MAILAPQTAPNFATGDYHRLLSAELLCGPSEPIPRWHYRVGFYASAAARDTNPKDPMWTQSIFVSIAEIVARGGADPRVEMYAQVMLDPVFAGTNAAGDDATSDPKPLLPAELQDTYVPDGQ